MSEELNVYGFGSYFGENTKHQDIDILIIHQSTEYKSCKLAIWCKQMLISRIAKPDITILSRSEEKQHSFITRSNACYIGKVRKSSADDDLLSIMEKIKQLDVPICN